MNLLQQFTNFINGDMKPDGVTPDGTGFKYLMDVFGLKPDKPNNNNAHLFNDIYACVNVLSDDIAKLPIKVYKKENSVINHCGEHNIQYLLGVRPNKYMTPYVFKKIAVTDLCFTGNFYALIEYDKNGKTTALHPLSSTKTTVIIDDNTREFYYQTIVGNKIVTLYPEEVIHIKGLTRNGYVGISPISVIADQSRANKTAINLNQAVLESGGTPQGILKISSMLSDKSKENIKKAWNKTNSREAIAVLDQGIEYQQIGISQADLQFLEGQKFNQQQIASVFKVPLHKINQLDHATYTNIEAQSLDYVKNTLQPLVVQFEEELTYKLFVRELEEDKNCYVKFNLDSELRGDSKSRAEVQEIQIRNGSKTVNEVRALNEDSPFDMENANIPLSSLNNTRLDWLEFHINSLVNKNAMGLLGKGGDKVDAQDGKT